MFFRTLKTWTLGLLAALTVGVSSPAAAGDLLYAAKIGALWHDVPELWSGFQVEKDAVDINVEAQFAVAWSMPWGWGTIRPVVGGTINTLGQTSHAYADARWQMDGPSNLFFGFGIGAAVHDGEIGPGDPNRKWLGSRVLFHVPAEIGYHLDAHNDVSFYFEHTSNAYTQTYNEGMDRLGVRYGYRF